jgi:hypothetical protein
MAGLSVTPRTAITEKSPYFGVGKKPSCAPIALSQLKLVLTPVLISTSTKRKSWMNLAREMDCRIQLEWAPNPRVLLSFRNPRAGQI